MDAFATRTPGELVREGYVAPHPVVARQRISERFSCDLSLSGKECEGITVIREIVASIDHTGEFAHCLFITAAHTHWGERRIVESFDPTRNVFLAGPVNDDRPTYPISFVFSTTGAVPYEWADSSVPVDAGDLNRIYDVISKVNAGVVGRFELLPLPLGLMIDHRFKKSMWDSQIFTFAEGPQNEEDGRAVIRPVIESVLQSESRYPDQIQVAWSALPPPTFDVRPISEGEAQVLARLEGLLQGAHPFAAAAFVEELEQSLHPSTREEPDR